MSAQINKKSQSQPLQSQDTIGSLVHAYNNYLSGLMGFTELALLECEQDGVKEHLELALDSGKEAVIFGRQLLSSIGRLQVVLKPVALKLLLIKLCEEKKQLSADITVLNADDELSIKTDFNWFLYCLQSIVKLCHDISNNRDSELHLTQTKSSVTIIISGNFQFTQEQMDNLFLPFYSSRSLLGKKDLGLAWVKGFISQMKGSIEWQQEQGFVIRLPKIKPLN